MRPRKLKQQSFGGPTKCVPRYLHAQLELVQLDNKISASLRSLRIPYVGTLSISEGDLYICLDSNLLYPFRRQRVGVGVGSDKSSAKPRTGLSQRGAEVPAS